jgi:hypothetical protein
MIEIWFEPAGGRDEEPVLLELRPYNPKSDPLTTWRLGGGRVLIAGGATIVTDRGRRQDSQGPHD